MSIDKIGKLLSLAENAGTQEEAVAALGAAQRLATVYQISLAEARMHAESKTRRETPIAEEVALCERGRQIRVRLRDLMCSIAKVNDVQVVWRSPGNIVELIGLPSDIDVAKSTYSQASVTMLRLCEEYLDSTDEWRTAQRDTYRWNEADENFIVATETVKVTRSTARHDYMEGFTGALSARQWQERGSAIKTAEQAHADRGEDSRSTAVALRAKSDEVQAFFKAKHPRVRGVTSGVRSTGSQAAYGRGRSDGASFGRSSRGVGGGAKGIAS